MMLFSLLRVQKIFRKIIKKKKKKKKRYIKWANLNEMTFGIEKKRATMVIKPMNFQASPN